MIKTIGFVSYPVQDMDRARKFYQEMFDLKINPDLSVSDTWTEFLVGDSAISLGKMEGWEPSANGGCAALEVEDFDATIERLKGAETPVEFSMEPQDFPTCRMAMIRDSEGNSVVIHKLKAK